MQRFKQQRYWIRQTSCSCSRCSPFYRASWTAWPQGVLDPLSPLPAPEKALSLERLDLADGIEELRSPHSFSLGLLAKLDYPGLQDLASVQAASS